MNDTPPDGGRMAVTVRKAVSTVIHAPGPPSPEQAPPNRKPRRGAAGDAPVTSPEEE